jgi:hypothetical protein
MSQRHHILAEISRNTDVPDAVIIKALPMIVPDTVLQHDAEKKRIKKGILDDSEEQAIFEKMLYLPYLDFTYQFPTEKGLLSKQTVLEQGRSVVLALREADFGFSPELAVLAPQLVETESEPESIVEGVDSTVLVNERLEELKRVLSDYDMEWENLLTNMIQCRRPTPPERISRITLTI